MNNSHYNPNLKKYAHELRTQTVSRAEKYIWKALLSKKQIGVKFKRQRPISNYIVDFFSQEIGLIIEIDGNSHHNKGEYDLIRQTKLESLGFVFLRFNEGEVLNNLDEVYSSVVYAVYVLKNSSP